MNKIELLAPAGSRESLIAAVQNGADAVYLGGTKFSARAYASNFDKENMEWAIDYCHLYGVKVYVTLNTLIKDSEMNEALEYAQFLHNVGVDAVIIQDYGLAQELRTRLPELELHASTQMTVHNAEGAKFLHQRGFDRIVLSRELHIDEIRKVSKEYNIESEIFVHGALCICYSGQCLMSSMIGGRSGNRGRCAQPCRLPYDIFNDKGAKKSGYIMSPKDVCTIEDIEKIIDSGTSSLKVEGRMKRPEYVAGIVSSYRRAIDAVYHKKALSKKEKEDAKGTLMQLFNREGFSKAYLFGNIGRDMISLGFPKNTGVRVGKVKNNVVEVEGEISVGDGIRVGDGGFIISSILKGNEKVERAQKGDKVQLKPKKYKNGDVAFKTSDVTLNKELGETFRSPFARKILLDCTINMSLGLPVTIKTKYMGKTYIVKGEVLQEALKKPLDKEKVEKNLKKSGDTPFRFEKIYFECFHEGFMPVSALNDIRRTLIEKIEKDLVKVCKNSDKLRERNPYKIESEDLPEVLITVKSSDQLKVCKAMGVRDIAVDLTTRGMWNIDAKIVKGCYIKVPNIVKDKEFSPVVKKLEALIPEAEGIITSNLGIIEVFSGRTRIFGDYKLNLFNRDALSFFSNDLQGAYFSSELNRKEINEISKDVNDFGVLVYGKVELMVSEYCPIGSSFGGKTSKKNCNRVCEREKFHLIDRKNVQFKIETDTFCRSYIYNNIPMDLIWSKENFSRRGIGMRIDFVHESSNECKEVIKYFRGQVEELEWETTKGRFSKGVE